MKPIEQEKGENLVLEKGQRPKTGDTSPPTHSKPQTPGEKPDNKASGQPDRKAG